MAIFIGSVLGTSQPRNITKIFTNGMICMGFMCGLILIIGLKSEYLFIKFGFDAETIDVACKAMKLILPSLFAMAIGEALKSLLNAQGYFNFIMISKFFF